MSVSIDELAGLVAQLRHTPQLLQLMLAGASEEDLRWKPSPLRFSIAEVLAHMAHVDDHCFGVRLRRVLQEENPVLESYDDAAFLSQPADLLADGLARLSDFAATRARAMAMIEPVTVEQAGRTGLHSQLGPMTASELLNVWAFHDLGHVRQVAEVLRARRYYPHIGPFQPLYTVRP